MLLKPNQILITLYEDSIDVDDVRKKETLNNTGLVILYLQRLMGKKQQEIVQKVEYIPDFEIGDTVTLKGSPGYTLFKVLKNFGTMSEIEKLDRSGIEKMCGMTFYVHRISLILHKEKK